MVNIFQNGFLKTRVKGLKPIAAYTSELFEKTQMNPRKAAKQMSYSPNLAWQLMGADLDINYTEAKKEEIPVFGHI